MRAGEVDNGNIRLRFSKTPQDTNGELLEMEAIYRPSSFFELMYGLAAAGKTDSRGAPNLLHMALIARHYKDEFVLASSPRMVQTCIFGMLARIARLLGYSATIDSVE